MCLTSIVKPFSYQNMEDVCYYLLLHFFFFSFSIFPLHSNTRLFFSYPLLTSLSLLRLLSNDTSYCHLSGKNNNEISYNCYKAKEKNNKIVKNGLLVKYFGARLWQDVIEINLSHPTYKVLCHNKLLSIILVLLQPIVWVPPLSKSFNKQEVIPW